MSVETEKLKDFADKATNPVEFVSSALAFHIHDYCVKRDHNRRWAFRLKMYSVLIAACTTIILGFGSSSLIAGEDSFWDGGAVPYFSALALVLSASVTVVSSWEAFSGYDWKWIRYRTTLADLYDLKDDLAIRKLGGSPISEKEIESFYDRLKQILHDTNTEWARRRAPTEKQTANAALASPATPPAGSAAPPP